MATENGVERWINRGDECCGGAFRVESPGDGVFLVRADGPYRAAETLVEDFLGYSVVDEAIERCRVRPAHDVAAPGLRNIDVHPRRCEPHGDGEFSYEASYDGAAFRASIVGYGDGSEREAVENLVGALAELGVAGSVRVCRPFEAEPVPLAEWRARDFDDEEAVV